MDITPIEFGLIIKWRQGEIIGLGSSSIVYSAIRTDNNTFMAVKKFKVVSNITGIDNVKLKIIKVSSKTKILTPFIERNLKVQATHSSKPR